LYACPYRATFVFQRPQGFDSYLGGNWSDTEGTPSPIKKMTGSF